MTSKQRVYAILDKVSAGWRERRTSQPTTRNETLKNRGVVCGVITLSCGFTNEELANLPF